MKKVLSMAMFSVVILCMTLFSAQISYCDVFLQEDAQGLSYWLATDGPAHFQAINTSKWPITLTAWKDDQQAGKRGSITLEPGQSTGKEKFNYSDYYIHCYYNDQKVSCGDYTSVPDQYKDDWCLCGSCGGSTELQMAAGCG